MDTTEISTYRNLVKAITRHTYLHFTFLSTYTVSADLSPVHLVLDLCLVHVVRFNLLTTLVTDSIQKRRAQPGLFSFG